MNLEEIAISEGCFDGAEEPEDRNAWVEFQSETHLVAFLLSNEMGLEGEYQFQIENLDDDYADELSEHMTSAPLHPNEALDGAFQYEDETDLFRYDAPPGGGNYLQIVMNGAAGLSATVEVYEASPPAVPSGSPLAAGTGGAELTVSVGESYYVLVRGEDVGSYAIVADVSACGESCDRTGTYDEPLPLPSVDGGIVAERLAASAYDETGGFDYLDCADGVTCDWFWMDLERGERMTATVFNVWDDACGIELAVYAPDDQQYFGDTVSYRWPSLADRNGSMEQFGAQLAFEAPADGRYRLRVLASEPEGGGCPRYDMAVARGPYSQPWIPPEPL